MTKIIKDKITFEEGRHAKFRQWYLMGYTDGKQEAAEGLAKHCKHLVDHHPARLESLGITEEALIKLKEKK